MGQFKDYINERQSIVGIPKELEKYKLKSVMAKLGSEFFEVLGDFSKKLFIKVYIDNNISTFAHSYIEKSKGKYIHFFDEKELHNFLKNEANPDSVQIVDDTRAILPVNDEDFIKKIKNIVRPFNNMHGKASVKVRPMKRKEGFKLYIDVNEPNKLNLFLDEIDLINK